MNRLFSFLFLLGCSRHYAKSDAYYPQEQYYQDDYETQGMYAYAEAEPPPPMPASAGARSMDFESAVVQAPVSKRISKKGEDAQKDDTDTGSERMIHYNGSATLLVSRLPETLDKLEEIAVAHGGGLISRSASNIMLQVPRENFDQAYAAALELGEVLNKNIATTDVTEAFTDTALRLEAMKTTRDRLIELLAKTKDEAEKVRILQQIQRLSEDIDSKEALLRGLKNLANFSNITIQLQLRQAGNMRHSNSEVAGFQWINRLSPFEGYVLHDSKKLKLEAPEGMVVLDPKGHYHAESADKANVFAGRLPNDPEGTAEFWKEAIIKRIGGEYAEIESFEAGEYLGLRLKADDEDGYVWTLYLSIEGKWLNVIQAYYPSLEHEGRLKAGVQSIVTGGAQ